MAQTTFERTYGGTGNDYGYSVAQTTEGGYIIVGSTRSYGSGFTDVYLIKTNPSGDIIWTRTYGGTDDDWGRSVAQTTDGGYIIAGSTRSYGVIWNDVYLIKTDSIGDTLWTKTYSGGYYYEYGYSVAQTTDRGYIISGTVESYYPHWRDVYLIKTDSLGATLWTSVYGSTSHDYGYSVAQTTDGGYIIAGITVAYPGTSDAVYVIKTDFSGITLWDETYDGIGNDCGWSVAQTTDGGYIIAGETESYGAGGYDVYLISLGELPYGPKPMAALAMIMVVLLPRQQMEVIS